MNPLFLVPLAIGSLVLMAILADIVSQAIAILTPIGFLAVLVVAALFWLASHNR